jgi:hypothetical protein
MLDLGFKPNLESIFGANRNNSEMRHVSVQFSIVLKTTRAHFEGTELASILLNR